MKTNPLRRTIVWRLVGARIQPEMFFSNSIGSYRFYRASFFFIGRYRKLSVFSCGFTRRYRSLAGLSEVIGFIGRFYRKLAVLSEVIGCIGSYRFHH